MSNLLAFYDCGDQDINKRAHTHTHTQQFCIINVNIDWCQYATLGHCFTFLLIFIIRSSLFAETENWLNVMAHDDGWLES